MAENIVACKYEQQSPGFSELFPKVMMGLDVFHLEGIDGTAKNWKEFGQWYADKILNGSTKLPEATQLKIKTLVGTETDPIKKAKIVYEFDATDMASGFMFPAMAREFRRGGIQFAAIFSSRHRPSAC